MEGDSTSKDFWLVAYEWNRPGDSPLVDNEVVRGCVGQWLLNTMQAARERGDTTRYRFLSAVRISKTAFVELKDSL